MRERPALLLGALPELGAASVFRIALYRALSLSGYYRLRLPVGEAYSGPFFRVDADDALVAPVTESERAAILKRAERVLSGELQFFANEWRVTGFPPTWGHRGERIHWESLDEFAAGDIKMVWEPSRFDGLIFLCQAYCCSRDQRFIDACEAWLSSWVTSNPSNSGPNWKCAQETALRLMSFVVVCSLLQQYAGLRCGQPALQFIREHARRIVPTMLYAVAQDNNHATSEAAALYLAGSYLLEAHEASRESESWRRSGRRRLERCVNRLVMKDGSFSQNSLNYHRLMLDTLSLVEVWRLRIADELFSNKFRDRLAAATVWLETLVDPESGDAPNLGANDGARILPLGIEPFRDYRPSALLASRLFRARESTGAGQADAGCRWLGVSPAGQPSDVLPLRSIVFADGGYAVLPLGMGKLVLRLPKYRFRPSHADALHLDLWWRGGNILRDSGSYSYNAYPDASEYFSETVSHNTVEFDGRSQMPRISRFLFGAWVAGDWTHVAGAAQEVIEAGYRDWRRGSHVRRVTAQNESVIVEDRVAGFSINAVLRWRLAPGSWKLVDNVLRGERATLTILCDSGEALLRLVDGAESRHYGEQTVLPVLEAEITRPGAITTHIELR